MRQTGNTRKEKAVLCLSYFYENQSYYRLSSVSEPEVSPVILLNQSEVFKHDLPFQSAGFRLLPFQERHSLSDILSVSSGHLGGSSSGSVHFYTAT